MYLGIVKSIPFFQKIIILIERYMISAVLANVSLFACRREYSNERPSVCLSARSIQAPTVRTCELFLFCILNGCICWGYPKSARLPLYLNSRRHIRKKQGPEPCKKLIYQRRNVKGCGIVDLYYLCRKSRTPVSSTEWHKHCYISTQNSIRVAKR